MCTWRDRVVDESSSEFVLCQTKERKKTVLEERVCQRNMERARPGPNEIGNTNREGVSWQSHAGVMILRPGLHQLQPISDRCLLRLRGQCLRLSTQQHISFRLVGAIKVRRGWRPARWLLYYIEVCLKHSVHERFQANFTQPAVFYLIENSILRLQSVQVPQSCSVRVSAVISEIASLLKWQKKMN